MELNAAQKGTIRSGWDILRENGFVLMNLDCRTGKTRIALELLERLREVDDRPALFVTKKHAIPSVLSDLEDYDGLEVVVKNYEAVKGEILAKKWGVVVCDEVHCCSTYPKASLRWKNLAKISRKCPYVIMLSAALAVESPSQWYHMLKLTKNGPFERYSSFYKWFKDYGIPSVTYISGGQKVNSYKKAKKDDILTLVNPFVVKMSQKEAGFKSWIDIVEHSLENRDLDYLAADFKKEKVLTLGDRVVLGDTPGALSQKLSMMYGGTLIDESGEPFVLPDEYDPTYKIQYIASKVDKRRKYAIFTRFIAERKLIFDFFGDRITDDIDEFRNSSDKNLWVGSIKSYSEGVDLSYCDALIIYSLTYSFVTFLEVLNRSSNYRVEGARKVHLLLCGFDFKVYKALQEKGDFDF